MMLASRHNDFIVPVSLPLGCFGIEDFNLPLLLRVISAQVDDSPTKLDMFPEIELPCIQFQIECRLLLGQIRRREVITPAEFPRVGYREVAIAVAKSTGVLDCVP